MLSRLRSHLPLAVTLSAVLVATACGTSSTGEDASGVPTNPDSVTSSAAIAAPPVAVVTNLEAPWSIAFVDSTPLVSERDSGRILEVTGTTTRVVGQIDQVAAQGEGGLLGIAARDNFLYAFYTSATDNRIERFPLTGSPGSYALGAGQMILDGLPAASNHNGGRIAFGPDGMLYATAGDASQPDLAQDLDSLAGKILRMTPDGQPPQDNPFPDSLVYSYGHRNSQGIAWGPGGALYASEFGQNTWDELNRIVPGGNYGWPLVEGIAETNADSASGSPDDFVDPLQQWPTDDASPSGVAVAGSQLYVANLRGERLRSVPLDNLGTATELFDADFGRLRDVVVAPNGELWILTNNTDGRGDPVDDDDRIIAVPAR